MKIPGGKGPQPLVLVLSHTVPYGPVKEIRLAHKVLSDPQYKLVPEKFDEFLTMCLLYGAKALVQEGFRAIRSLTHAACGHPWEAVVWIKPPVEPTQEDPDGFPGEGYCGICRDEAEKRNRQAAEGGAVAPALQPVTEDRGADVAHHPAQEKGEVDAELPTGSPAVQPGDGGRGLQLVPPSQEPESC